MEYLDLSHPGGTILRPSLSSEAGQLKDLATLLVAARIKNEQKRDKSQSWPRGQKRWDKLKKVGQVEVLHCIGTPVVVDYC